MVTALKSLAEGDAVFFLDPLKGMCPNGHCTTYVNGEFIYRDASHIRRNLRLETDDALARTMGLYTALATGEGQTRISEATEFEAPAAYPNN